MAQHRKRTPINPTRKKEYEKEKEVVKKINEQIEIQNQRKTLKLKQQMEKEEKHKQELTLHMRKDVMRNQKRAHKYVKSYAVSKAAEVISIIEKMAMGNQLNIETKTIKNTVINNLVDRNRAKETMFKPHGKDTAKDHDYVKEKEKWSMQLLMKLGLIPKMKIVDSDDTTPERKKEKKKKKKK